MEEPPADTPESGRFIPGKEKFYEIEQRPALKDELPGNGYLERISRIRGFKEKDQKRPTVPPELERIIQDVDREIQSLINGLAADCNAHISVMKMEPSLKPPQPPFFYEQVRFYYEIESADGTPIGKFVTWFLPYLLRDAAFNYAPWDVRGVLSAFPSKGILEVLNRAREERTKEGNKKTRKNSD